MSIWDKLKAELIDIIEWLDPSNDTMMYRFERYDNEIKYGARLIVREGQSAVFVNEGQIADVFAPGTYTLETQNLPILATLKGWKYGFHSPFKAEVYFASTRRFTDLKWGTQNPVMLRDKEFGPIRLRAFGTYVMRVEDAGTFVREIVGTDAHFTTDEVTEQLRNMIVSRFTDILGESGIPILDLAGNYDELGVFVTNRIQPEFKTYGLELTKLLVENISLPPAVEEALDKRSSMGVIGDLGKYTQFQTAEAMRDAAKNPGGMAAGGMGMGMGFAMGNQMANAMGAGTQSSPATAPEAGASSASAATPPPIPGAVRFHVAIDGSPAGPFDVAAIARKIAAGEISRDTLVWKPGMAEWAKASTASELETVFASAPPPLPPTT